MAKAGDAEGSALTRDSKRTPLCAAPGTKRPVSYKFCCDAAFHEAVAQAWRCEILVEMLAIGRSRLWKVIGCYPAVRQGRVIPR